VSQKTIQFWQDKEPIRPDETFWQKETGKSHIQFS